MKLNMYKGMRKKLIALFLFLTLFFQFTVPVFAWPSQEGVPCDAYYGDTITGSDGQDYRSVSGYYTMTYLNNGSTRFDYHTGNVPYRHYVLELSDGETRWVYCIESGVAFGNSSYISESHVNSAYFQLLPDSAQQGIMLTTLYGWYPGKAIPTELAGLSADDFFMATQVLIWEFQQQLRSSATSGRTDNNSVRADQYFEIIFGRPAEHAYDWILDQITQHSRVPSFTAISENAAPTHKLKYDPDTKLYTLTLTDTENLDIDLNRVSGNSGVTVTRTGDQYTFTSSTMIQTPVTVGYQKNVPTGDEQLLIWGDPTQQRQTMLTGTADPVFFFAKFETDTFGTLELQKISEDDIVEGISFEITGNGETKLVTTGTGGVIETQLLPGTYTVREIPKDSYVTPEEQTIIIESGQKTTFQFHNVLKKFRIEVTKADTETGSAQGNASLVGAVYGIYHNGDLIDTYTTDVNGQFTTKYYICGSGWILQEISSSEGYLLDPTEYVVGADPTLYALELNTTQNTVYETVEKGRIQLIKHTDQWDPDIDPEERNPGGHTGMIEQPEDGAVFQIYLKDAGSYDAADTTERDIMTTDRDGLAISKDLPYGYYVVHQTHGLEGQAFIPDFTVFIKEDQETYSYILNNTAITGRVRIEKRDIDSGKIIPISGIGFKVRDLKSGEFISQTDFYPNPITLDVFYTSDEGWLMLPEALAYGDYELVEEITAYGYVLDQDPVPFTIDGTDAIVTVIKENKAQKGKIVIQKTGKIFQSVVETENIFQPVYETTGLAGAVFEIIAEEDIQTGDGTVHAKKGDVVDTLTTTKNGAESKLLHLGKYRIVETEYPDGMVIPDPAQEHIVELTYAGQEYEIASPTELRIQNERQKVAIRLLKSIEADPVFEIGQEDTYQAISFALYAQEELEGVDGSVIPVDGLIEIVKLVPDPKTQEETDALYFSAAFTSDLPFGKYYIREYTSDTFYLPMNTKFPVEFKYNGPKTQVVQITANDGNPIENKLIRGQIKGLKVDATGNGLSGAVIGLFRPDTVEFSKETALSTAESAENGVFGFDQIPIGHWVVREIAAPKAYVLNVESIDVYIDTHEQVIELQIENVPIRGHVQLVKIDNDDPETKLAGAIFEIYADINENQVFDPEDILIGAMDEPDTGHHEKRDLAFGGYFVLEKQSPKNYKLDATPYYFEIRSDGEILQIANSEETGRFINVAMKGVLKIIKTSSDGKKEGFSFLVESKDLGYSQTFVTNADGEILVEGLRIGKYTVSEVQTSATAGYVLPDPVNIEILVDQTLEVRVHNDKVTVTVPKTGDDNNLALWFTLMGIGAAGGIVSILVLRKKLKLPKPDTTKIKK